MKFYRYETVQYAEYDFDGELVSPNFPNPKLELREYDSIKETPQGYWISNYPYSENIIHCNYKYIWKKWVSKTSRKRFAYPTKKAALINYIKRTERRIGILESHLSLCKMGLYLANAKAKRHEIQGT